MAKIIRKPQKATGGITDAERRLMDDHTKLWIARAFRTDPIEPSMIVPAIEGIYDAAKLKRPRVIIVPSPIVMAFAYGAAAAIWYRRKTHGATFGATRHATADATDRATFDATARATADATYRATYNATDSATRDVMRSATRDATASATRHATYRATDNATDNATASATRGATADATASATASATDSATDNAARACHEIAGSFGIACAKRWHASYQGGNMWGFYDCYLAACRDILGLRLPQHAAYAAWEAAAIHGGFRVMHEEFCMVSDFPEFIHVDAENRPHCETGPSHRWRDGWSLYHWHGVRVPPAWIEDRANIRSDAVLAEPNMEVRRAGIEIIGWDRILSALPSRVIDADPDPQIGTLVEIDLPGLGGNAPIRAQFLRVLCGTGRQFAVGVDPNANAKTALDAQAWLHGLSASDFRIPQVRT